MPIDLLENQDKLNNQNDWESIAKTNPNIQKWYSELPESKQGIDVVDFMKQQKEQGIYDYEKAISQGLMPSFQSEHNQYRWNDVGKGKNNPNLYNQDSQSQPIDLLAETQFDTPQPTIQQDNTGDLLKLAGLGLGGAGLYAGKKAVDWYRQPFKERTQVLQQFEPLKTELQIPSKTELGYIPTKISQNIRQIKEQKAFDLIQAKNETSVATQALKQSLNLFDDTLLSLNVGDLATTIKENYPKFLKDVSNKYSAGLERTNQYFEQSGKTLNSLDFDKNILSKTINMARQGGILDDELTPLLKLKEFLAPSIDKSGYMTSEIPLSFSQAKGYVSNLINQDPYSPTSTLLRRNWGEFLEKSAPESVRTELAKLNKQFKPFAEARTRMSKLIDTRTGEFDTKGLNKYLLDFTKSRIEEGQTNLMQLLGEGSELVTPIKGVKEKFSALTQLKEKRYTLKQSIPATQISNKEKLFQLEQEANKQINKLNSLRDTYNELATKLNVTEEAVGKRKVIPGMVKGLGLLKKTTLPFFAIYPLISTGIDFKKDPEGTLMRFMGLQPAPKGTKERDIQTGRLI